jgi:hypothetical protein
MALTIVNDIHSQLNAPRVAEPPSNERAELRDEHADLVHDGSSWWATFPKCEPDPKGSAHLSVAAAA